ncbi:hypothetical protein QZH41_009434 [Actinostola sp. cb2023]|nr:hypothetical protein QZH41_009434 [Actinostola sp. cb2023]
MRTSPTSGEQPSVLMKFVSAGLAASIAEAVTIPIDTAKVRLQIQGESAVMSNIAAGVKTDNPNVRYRGMFGTMITLAKREGVKTMYKGLIPGIHRQLCFASIRIGLYDSVKKLYGDEDVNNPKVFKKIAASITTGIMAVSVAQPTEVVKIRFQADAARYNTGAIATYGVIFRNEGLKGLWKGVFPNMARLATVNASELVVYDSIKGFFLRRKWLADDYLNIMELQPITKGKSELSLTKCGKPFQCHMIPFQCHGTISMLWNHFNAMKPFQCHGTISMPWNHFNAMEPFQCHGTISMPWNHFNAMEPFQCHGTISMPWNHFNAMEPFQCHGTISMPFHAMKPFQCHETISMP